MLHTFLYPTSPLLRSAEKYNDEKYNDRPLHPLC